MHLHINKATSSFAGCPPFACVHALSRTHRRTIYQKPFSSICLRKKSSSKKKKKMTHSTYIFCQSLFCSFALRTRAPCSYYTHSSEHGEWGERQQQQKQSILAHNLHPRCIALCKWFTLCSHTEAGLSFIIMYSFGHPPMHEAAIIILPRARHFFLADSRKLSKWGIKARKDS